MCSPGQFQALQPTGWCNISPGGSLGGLVLSCEEWEADSRRLSRLLLQASVFEWKIIHLEGHCLGEEGQPALRLGDKLHAEMFVGKGAICQAEARLATRALWCLLASATRSHLRLPRSCWALASSTTSQPAASPVTNPRDVMSSCRRCLVSSFPQGWP